MQWQATDISNHTTIAKTVDLFAAEAASAFSALASALATLPSYSLSTDAARCRPSAAGEGPTAVAELAGAVGAQPHRRAPPDTPRPALSP
mgnify:CR=1 FL=1